MCKRQKRAKTRRRAAQSAVTGKNGKNNLKRKKPAATYFPAKSSIIGVRELDFRVRNGNGYCLSTVATGILCQVILQPSAQELSSRHRRLLLSVKVSDGKKTFSAAK